MNIILWRLQGNNNAAAAATATTPTTNGNDAGGAPTTPVSAPMSPSKRFTVRRELDKQREEMEQIQQLRQVRPYCTIRGCLEKKEPDLVSLHHCRRC